MKKFLNDGIAVGIIISIIIAFFFILFYPTPKLLVTPDFGRSDAWHFSISTKYIYWEELKNNRLPLWSGLIGGGFPLFAEGQIGALFLPNIIIFKLFDFPFAYNASLVITVITFALGIYAMGRVLTKSIIASLFGGITASLSGIIIPQLPHITLLQGLSLTPWIFLATHNLIKNHTWISMIMVAFLFTEQIFTGFPQAVFISFLFSTSYLLWNCRSQKNSKMLSLAYLSALTLGIGMASVQLLPSIEFLTQSSVPRGFSVTEASYFSFPWIHIKTLLAPYLLGNPKLGTYPHFAAFDGSIFWENSGFVGLVPLTFAFISFVRYYLAKLQGSTLTTLGSRSFTFFIIACLMSLLLMTGKHSPMYLLFSFWPFTLFRVPSRFIWIFVISTLTLSSFGVSFFISKIVHIAHSHIRHFFMIFILFLFSLHVYQLWNTWKSYHLLEPALLWLQKPAIIDVIDKDRRIASIGTENLHNKYFVSSGWTNPEPYRTLRSALATDSNAIWGVSSAQAYAGRNLRKKSLADGILLAETSYGDTTATISALGQKILSLQNVTTIISAFPLTDEGLTLTHTLSDSLFPLFVYTNPWAVPRAYLAHDAVRVSTVSEAAGALRSDLFIPGSSVLVGKPILLGKNQKGKATITHQSDQRMTIDVSDNTTDALLVLADTYYPGWTATVDGKQEPIIAVNIFQRGIQISPGNHLVEFLYKPKSIIYGLTISVVSILVALILAVYPRTASLFHIDLKAPWRALGFYHNHARGKLHKK